jgi:hypothetical protein
MPKNYITNTSRTLTILGAQFLGDRLVCITPENIDLVYKQEAVKRLEEYYEMTMTIL